MSYFDALWISIFCFALQNALLPVHERQANQTDKETTGPFDRQHLLDHLEEQAKNAKEPDNYVPYKKETRGKVWRPKEHPGRKDAEPMLPDDLSEVLDNATDEEMLELAGKHLLNRTGLIWFMQQGCWKAPLYSECRIGKFLFEA